MSTEIKLSGGEAIRASEDYREVVRRSITGAYFVPLYGEHGYALADAPKEA